MDDLGIPLVMMTGQIHPNSVIIFAKTYSIFSPFSARLELQHEFIQLLAPTSGMQPNMSVNAWRT